MQNYANSFAILQVEEEQGGEKRTADSEELRQVATEATRSAKARWKDIESGKVEAKIEKTKIDMGNSVSYVMEYFSASAFDSGWASL